MAISEPTRALSEYLAAAADTPLPSEVQHKTRLHVLDTLAAIVSGSRMPAGEAGRRYAERHASTGTSAVIGSGLMVGSEYAALANGMSAHADETDDSHEPSLSHPGCAVVPAALAIAEGSGATGERFLRAVAAGYDAGTRLGMAIGHPERPLEGSGISSHAHVGVYAAASAAAVLLGQSAEQVRSTLSFAGQSAAGTTSWARDPYHVEKAFVFAGMPASNGVRAAQIVNDGVLGVPDPFSGVPNVLDAYAVHPRPEQLARELGETYEIMRTNIKKFAVGSPSQAPVQAALDLLEQRRVEPGEVQRLVIVIPHDLAQVVDNREMPNINVQYLVAGTVVDGRFSFAMAHDDARLARGAVRELMSRTELVYDHSVTGVRQARVEFHLRSGETMSAFVPSVRGTAANPMSEEEVVEKAADLISPILGTSASEALIDTVLRLGADRGPRELRAALDAGLPLTA